MTWQKNIRGLWMLLTIGILTYGLGSCGDTAGSKAAGEATETDMEGAVSVEEVAKLPPLEQGKALYTSYCQLCHGEQAKGNGAMADLLKIPPPDLTSIAERYGGFPKEQITEIISGQKQIEGHGASDMPIWWETFKQSEGLATEADVKDKIDYLVVYLESIQAG